MVSTSEAQEELTGYDVCICCGTVTSYKKTDNIIHRSGYIEGAGQLCLECSQIDDKEAEHAKNLWKIQNG